MEHDIRFKLSPMHLVAIVVVVLIILFSNAWVDREMKGKAEQPIRRSVQRPVPELEQAPVPETDDIVKRTRVETGSDYFESVFFRGQEVIATERTWPDGHTEMSGKVPDGPVKIINEFDRTSGEGNYKDNQPSGTSQVFNDAGQLIVESEYLGGRLLKKKEYYSSGKLRFEVDYTDALTAEEAWKNYDPKEAGIGKLYYDNGNLKYEWNVTRNTKPGFKKSYNSDGRLRYAKYIDEVGAVISEGAPASDAPLAEKTEGTPPQ